MIAAAASPSAARAARSGGEKAVEVAQHRRGRAPDEVAPRRAAGVERRARASTGTRAVTPSTSTAWRWWFAGFIRKASGTSNTSATSNGSACSVEAGLHQADHRRDDEAGAGGVGRQAAEHLDLERARGRSPRAPRAARWRRRRRRSASARPPGKLIWPGMVVEVVGALRQQHRQLVAQRPAAPAPRRAPARARRSAARP